MREWTWFDDRQRASSRIVRTGPKWFERVEGPPVTTVELETRTESRFGMTQRMGEVIVHSAGADLTGLSLRLETGYAVD